MGLPEPPEGQEQSHVVEFEQLKVLACSVCTFRSRDVARMKVPWTCMIACVFVLCAAVQLDRSRQSSVWRKTWSKSWMLAQKVSPY